MSERGSTFEGDVAEEKRLMIEKEGDEEMARGRIGWRDAKTQAAQPARVGGWLSSLCRVNCMPLRRMRPTLGGHLKSQILVSQSQA